MTRRRGNDVYLSRRGEDTCQLGQGLCRDQQRFVLLNDLTTGQWRGTNSQPEGIRSDEGDGRVLNLNKDASEHRTALIISGSKRCLSDHLFEQGSLKDDGRLTAFSRWNSGIFGWFHSSNIRLTARCLNMHEVGFCNSHQF